MVTATVATFVHVAAAAAVVVVILNRCVLHAEPHAGHFLGPKNYHLTDIKFQSQIRVPGDGFAGPALFYLS